MSHKLIAIWLDSADATLINQWMREGYLPNLAAICREGLYASVQSFEHSLAETVQQFMITGRSPKQTGFWSQLHYDSMAYSVHSQPFYNYADFPPFYALGPDRRVCALDFPQMNFHPDVHGIQLRGWGCHSPMSEFSTQPDSWSKQVASEIGVHPCHDHDYAVLQKDESLESLYQRCLDGVELRTKLCRLAWNKESWDLFFPVFSEIHLAGHYLLKHPANEAYFSDQEHQLQLRTVYERTDKAVGEIRSWIDAETHLSVFSIEGISENSDEVSSIATLPELMFRFSFPGRKAMDFKNLQPLPESPASTFNWVTETWNLSCRQPAWVRLLRNFLPLEKSIRIEHFFGADGYLLHPSMVKEMSYQPSLWYQPYWSEMKAFALPSFSDGFIRINLRGREIHGVVDPSDYDQVCSAVEETLLALKHPKTGAPVVKKMIRTRTNQSLHDPKLPPADLIVLWNNPDCFGHVLSSWGEIGPFSGIRAGQHIPDGFFMAVGPRVSPGTSLDSASVLDIPATLMDLMNVTPQVPLEGKSLLLKPKSYV